MYENEKEEQALDAMAKAFVDLIKMRGRDNSEAKTETKTEEKEYANDNLIKELVAISRKAKDSRSFIFLLESEDGNGCISILNGAHDKMENLLTATAARHKPFEDSLKKASVSMSLSAIDDLLKNNNPFKQKEPESHSCSNSSSYNRH